MSRLILCSYCIFIVVISGCAKLPRNPVPLDHIYEAEVVAVPGVRGWGGMLSSEMQRDTIASLEQEGPEDFVNPITGKKEYSALALSGGGSNGAFGAGFLYGWSKRENRPDFKLVTGISTGALIAPFAFLGPAYDEELKEVYTTIDTKRIIEKLNIFSILTTNESFSRSTPLQDLISEHIDERMLQAVALAHDQGRRLYVGTTHMDAQRLSVWNMGLIAKNGTKAALNLFKDVLLASASIPVAMPPVYIGVAVDGTKYDEMHTDGGTITQVFFHAGTINLVEAGKAAGLAIENDTFSRLYIIRNGQIKPIPRHVARSLSDISTRTLETSIKAATLNNLFRMYVLAQKERSEIFYVDIPADYSSESNELFDQEEMTRLFNLGMELGMSANPWNDSLPGFDQIE